MEELYDFEFSSDSEDNHNDFLEKLSGIQNLELRKKLETEFTNLKDKIKNKKNAEMNKIIGTVKKLKQKNEDPDFLVKRDEIIYSATMTSFIITVGMVFYPETIWSMRFISLKSLVLLLIRGYRYSRSGEHFYMIDYCYGVTVGMFLLVWVLKIQSFYMMAALFANATGPLTMAFVIYKYRLVWHDIDAYTSFYLHIAPSLVAWIYRFNCIDKEKCGGFPTLTEWDFWAKSLSIFGKIKIFLFGVGLYAIWAVIYWVILFEIATDHIEKNGYDTLYKYTKKKSKLYNRLIKKFNKAKNERMNQVIYMCTHVAIALGGFVYSSLVIHHRKSSILFLFWLLLTSIWSASSYYHKYFVSRYIKKIEDKAKLNREKRLRKEEKNSLGKTKDK